MTDRKLTIKQEKFIEVYLMTGNATKSALKAGYSRKTACSIGEENLRKPEIQAVIEQRRKKLREKVEISQKEWVAHLERIAKANLKDLISWGPDGVKLKFSNELADEQAWLVAEISETVTQ